MKITYKAHTFRGESAAIVEHANRIIREYARQGFDLTLRQLYYQFVSEALIPNNQRSYKRLGSIISNARMAGLISWEAITDRTRQLYGTHHFGTPMEAVRDTTSKYHIDKWADQPYRVEVWVEKDALRSVVGKAARELDIDYFSCRGYASLSSMWLAARRMGYYKEAKQKCVVLHLGDHDPSGIDMTRDIRDRFRDFFRRVNVKRIALNMDQIEDLNPPPNPAKTSDSRYHDYVMQYGEESWELDALKPTYIVNLIKEHVIEIRDEKKWKAKLEEEKAHKGLLQRAVNEIESWMEDEEEEDDG